MASLSITLDAGAQSATHSKTISGAHVTRLLDAYRSILGQIQDGEDENGQPIMRDRTNAEVFAAYCEGIFAGTKANVKRAEEEAAAETARSSVDEISFA